LAAASLTLVAARGRAFVSVNSIRTMFWERQRSSRRPAWAQIRAVERYYGGRIR
jgi:hypothetical protein